MLLLKKGDIVSYCYLSLCLLASRFIWLEAASLRALFIVLRVKSQVVIQIIFHDFPSFLLPFRYPIAILMLFSFLASLYMSLLNRTDSIISFFKNIIARFVTNLVFTFKFKDDFETFYWFVDCIIEKFLRESPF